ncbi:unnamed protein product [Mytilus coruscus]|uniref:Uncharacterized protein n=1 Tax=Mytilus coruscus TaxID=42192 RepID=A0A6J7ZZG6_MYTCO|nr:unnamed protein product [Mytilus coruscus]
MKDRLSSPLKGSDIDESKCVVDSNFTSLSLICIPCLNHSVIQLARSKCKVPFSQIAPNIPCGQIALNFMASVKNQVVNIMLFIMIECDAAYNVHWKRETNPVMFGDNVNLMCMVGRKEGCDSTTTRRWDGGPNNTILLLNGHSSNATKYYEITDDPCDNFSLVIMNFNMNDVNREYWCSFGFETSRQNLPLDERNFIGMPTKNNIHVSLQQRALELDLSIEFYKVFPKPKCKIKIGDEHLLNDNIMSNVSGLFINAYLHKTITIPKDRCHGNFSISCTLLTTAILEINKRLNCSFPLIEDFDMVIPIIIISTVLLLVCIMCISITIGCVYQMKRIKRNQRHHAISEKTMRNQTFDLVNQSLL